MVRLFWVKIVVALCFSYSAVVSQTSSSHNNNSLVYFGTSDQAFLTADDQQNKFDPFELIEKDEQNEIIEEDYDSQHISSFCYFSFRQSIYLLKFLKEKIPSIVFSDFISPKKLFVIFHCWKLHS